jgi:rhamnulokinase
MTNGKSYHLAVDLGADSGRVMLGTLEDDRVSLEEIHRFPNRVRKIEGHWDLSHLDGEIFSGLRKAAELGFPIASISTDSWAVDYLLLDAQGRLQGEPYCYRDPRTQESPARLFKVLPFSEIYEETGIQFLALNTLFQFEAQQHADSAVLAGADHFLNIADYFNARLSQVEVAEESMASTTQFYNPKTRSWSDKVISALGLPKSLFPKIVPSATVLGAVTGELATWPALKDARVVATCSHDTGAAVAAVPASGENWVYLSSGTWSRLGTELEAPIMTEAAREAGFTNEVGVGGTIRFLKNIAGLWVLQECRRAWEAAGQSYTYDEIMELATLSGPAESHLCLRDARFVSPGEMPLKITSFCRETGQPVPGTHGQLARMILESLALSYAQTLGELEEVVGRTFEKLHIVGGGSRSQLLNQLAADATRLTVIAGPVEATAVGNVLIQALALGRVKSTSHLRKIVMDSFSTQTFEPRPNGSFSEEVRARFQKLQPIAKS